MSSTEKKLFSQKDVRNHPHRSGFDLSKRKLFTAKVGELLPIYCKNVLPGDHWQFDAASFTRTQPVQTAAFTRINEYVDFFFIPYRLLWRNAPSSFTQMQDAKNVAQSLKQTQSINDLVPYVTIGDIFKCLTSNLQNTGDYMDRAFSVKDEVGANRLQATFKLLSYLGYGDFDKLGSNVTLTDLQNLYDFNRKVSILPLLAYQKVYFDFFRNQQWEENRAQAYNVDYMSQSTNIADYDTNKTNLSDLFNSGILSLRYANYAKDLLLGLLPSAQFGDVAEVSLSSSSTYGSIPNGTLLSNGTKVVDKGGTQLSTNVQRNDIQGNRYYVYASSENSEIKTGQIRTDRDVSIYFDQIDAAFNALDVRNMMATQKWAEISNTGDRTYRSQIEKHFGVKLPKTLDNNCTYIDGWTGSVAINEVVNTNLENSQADIKGKGVGDINAHRFSFDVKEHGIIIGIYHACPLMDYSFSAPSRDLTTVNISDFFIPEYDKLGYEEVLATDFFSIRKDNPVGNKFLSLGYAPRYWQYKTDVDEICGAFRTTLLDWVAPFDDSYLKNSLTLISGTNYKLDYRFFKINASILDDIFGINAHIKYSDPDALALREIDNDQLLVALDFQVFTNRNMDFNGLPY